MTWFLLGSLSRPSSSKKYLNIEAFPWQCQIIPVLSHQAKDEPEPGKAEYFSLASWSLFLGNNMTRHASKVQRIGSDWVVPRRACRQLVCRWDLDEVEKIVKKKIITLVKECGAPEGKCQFLETLQLPTLIPHECWLPCSSCILKGAAE